ncbi:MAG: hypothetical protein P4L73_01715, partial [Caulobacteraceae bacterium]|nr:hypothetical protein [Caulobacteraceae bacterium]
MARLVDMDAGPFLKGLRRLGWSLRPGSFAAFLAAAGFVAAAFVLRMALAPWIAGAQFITF